MSGINTNRSNITLPNDVSSEILQKTQEQSAIMSLARQIKLPGRGLTIPVITGDPEASWVDETNKKPVSNPSMSTKIMQAYKLAVIVPFSDEFKRDLQSLYSALVARLPLALAKKFDQTVFFGSAPGSNFDTFTAVTAQSMDTDVYGALVEADTDIAIHGGILNGFALSPQAKGVLLGATDQNKRPLFINNVADGAIPMLLGAKTTYTKGAYKQGDSADVIGFAGDWTQAMYGTVEGVKIDVSNQASLTISDQQVNLWERNMFAVRAEIEVGFRADTTVFNAFTVTPGGESGVTESGQS